MSHSSNRVSHVCPCGVTTTRIATSAPCTCDGCGATWSADCPPAGASVEVNEAAVSVAAPAASGQSAGIPSWFYSYRTARSVLGRVLRPGFDGRDEHVLRLAARVVIAGGVVVPLA